MGRAILFNIFLMVNELKHDGAYTAESVGGKYIKVKKGGVVYQAIISAR